MTPAEVRAFQSGPAGGPRPIDFLGSELVADGDLGPRTRWALDMATLPRWRQDVVRSALLMNGRREEGVNRGQWIDQDMAICRLDNDVDGDGPSQDGHPWCSAFACARVAAYSPHRFTPDASVRRLRDQLTRVDAANALPGDFASFLYPGGIKGHVGLLIAIGRSWAASVDGNLGNRVRVVRYPAHERQYHTVEARAARPEVPFEIRQYQGSTR